MKTLEEKLKELEEMCTEAENDVEGFGDDDARLTLCGNRIYVGHVRHLLRYLKEDNER